MHRLTSLNRPTRNSTKVRAVSQYFLTPLFAITASTLRKWRKVTRPDPAQPPTPNITGQLRTLACNTTDKLYRQTPNIGDRTLTKPTSG
ncbi:MAG: hypothetical protein AB1589_37085 [Cyanobacteriota bacterium]